MSDKLDMSMASVTDEIMRAFDGRSDIALYDSITRGYQIVNGLGDMPADCDLRVRHFVFPNPMDAQECNASGFTGVWEENGDHVAAIDSLATVIVRARGDGATHLWWRVPPTWEGEFTFGRMGGVRQYRLRMRGSFIWAAS